MVKEGQQQLNRQLIKEILKEKRKKFLRDDEINRAKREIGKPFDLVKETERLVEYGKFCNMLLITNDFSSMERTVDEILIDKGIEVDKTSEEYQSLCKDMLRMWIHLIEVYRERELGNYEDAHGLLEEVLEEVKVEQSRIEIVKSSTHAEPQPDSQELEEKVLFERVVEEYM